MTEMGFKKLNASLGLSMDHGYQIRDPAVLAMLEIWLKRNPAWSGESAGLILGAEQPSVRSSGPAKLELLSQTINPSLPPFPGSQDVRRAICVPALLPAGPSFAAPSRGSRRGPLELDAARRYPPIRNGLNPRQIGSE